jgi:chitinase
MRFLRIASLLVLLVALSAPHVDAQSPENESNKTFCVVGYLPDYRLASIDFDQIKNVTDLILFSAQPAAEGSLDMSRLKNADWNKLNEFKTQNKIRLILSVGGWDRSVHFATVTKSTDLRRRFVDSLTQICIEKNLDGVDFDWEHPKDESEQLGYAALLADCRQAFRSRNWTVSVTIAAWQGLHPDAISAVDRIQVMSYDNPGQHATLQTAKSDIAKLIKSGMPADKLVLGVPFYGRHVTDRDRTLTYREIVAKQQSIIGDEFEGFYFNGPKTIQAKIRYAKQSKLAGIMIWELGQDAPPPNALLDVISRSLKK